MKLFKYLEDQNSEIILKDIKVFNIEANSIIDVFKQAYKHEQFMTNELNHLSDLAMQQKDHATYSLLQWYINEQIEEEALFSDIIDKLKMVGEDGYGLYSIDKELGGRVFVDPTAV